MPNFKQPGAARRPVEPFEAQFDGECDNCGADIFEGEMIGYLPGADRVSCGDCVHEHNEEQHGC